MSAATRRMLGSNVKALLVRAKDFQYLVDPEDYGVGLHLRRYGRYGEDELDRLSELISVESNVLVVGTHVGTLAIPLSGRCASVTGIEANPNTYQLLEANIAVNRVENLTALNIAASDREQELTFLVNRSNSGGSKIKPQKKDYRYYYDKPVEISVPGFPLDQQFPDSTFDLIVMDIEGSEYFALKGMQQLLKKAKHLVIEFVPHHLQNVSNVSVDEFLKTLTMFDQLSVPTLNRSVPKDQFREILTELYDSGASDDGIIFSRTSSS